MSVVSFARRLLESSEGNNIAVSAGKRKIRFISWRNEAKLNQSNEKQKVSVEIFRQSVILFFVNLFSFQFLCEQQQVSVGRGFETHHSELFARASFYICSPRNPASESMTRSAFLPSPALAERSVCAISCRFHTLRRTRSTGPTPRPSSQLLKRGK